MRPSHGRNGEGQSRRRTTNGRNVDDLLPSSSSSGEQQLEEIFYVGPPRIQLSSTPPVRPTARTNGGPQVQQQTSQRVHSFQVDGFTAVTAGDVPFMRVGPRATTTTTTSAPTAPINDPSRDQRGGADPLSPLGNSLDLMMNAAATAGFLNGGFTTATTTTTTAINNHNLLLHQQQQQRRAAATAAGSNGISPLRNKIVYELECCYCQTQICGRAMRAILLADTKVELYSTDVPPSRLRLLDDDRMTQGCNCRIRDTACATCGNVLGYHVSQPCEKCLEARNNGHFWMFYSDTVVPSERPDPAGNGKPLYWGSLTQASEFIDAGGFSRNRKPYDCFCR